MFMLLISEPVIKLFYTSIKIQMSHCDTSAIKLQYDTSAIKLHYGTSATKLHYDT